MTYRVKDWNQHFENNKSRERDRCQFVCVPNKQHGMGFTRLMGEPDGAAIYGVWHMILGACSQQRSPRAGWLTDDGTAGGHRWTIEDIAFKFRRPESEIVRALEVLTSPRVGWIEVSANLLPADCPSPAPVESIERPPDARELPAECLGRKEGKKEEKEPPISPVPGELEIVDGTEKPDKPRKPPSLKASPAFDAFWAAWPGGGRKRGKEDCLKKWVRGGLDHIAGNVMAALATAKESRDFTKENGAFIPMPVRWLNQTPWTEIDANAPPPGQSPPPVHGVVSTIFT